MMVRTARRRQLTVAAMFSLAILPIWAGETAKERVREPAPVVLDIGALQLEALHWGKAIGLGQNGGFVMARERVSHRVLWIHRVYAIDTRNGMEGDKQDLFITAMTLEPTGHTLRISNEKGQVWRFDLRTFASSLMAG